MNYAKLTINTPTHRIALGLLFDSVAVNQIQQAIATVLRGNQSSGLTFNFYTGDSVLLPAEVVRSSLFVFQPVPMVLPQPKDPRSQPTPP